MPVRRILTLLLGVVLYFAFLAIGGTVDSNAAEVNAGNSLVPGPTPVAISTFNCISLYWKPKGGAANNICSVEYKEKGASKWSKAQDLWYDISTYSDHNLVNSYRGSIVNLKPDTKYDIKLSLKSGAAVSLTQKTWTENFPVKKTIKVTSGSSAFTTPQGGDAAGGYVVYDGTDAVIDTSNNADNCIVVNQSYVIIRNFTLKGARKSAIVIADGARDVVIEGCDISKWGDTKPGKIFGNSVSAIGLTRNNTRIVIQRNRMHNPNYDTNSWGEGSHPYGPCGIGLDGETIKDANGRLLDNGIWNCVVRYNEIASWDRDIAFEDGVQGGPPDTDIYGNKICDINDNGLELESGGDRNTRVWGNYFYNIYNSISSIPVHLGPLYVFRNVSDGFNNTGKADTSRPYKVGGNKYSGSWYELQSTRGAAYYYHNTNLQADADDGFQQADGGPLYLVARNNILLAKHKSIQSCTDKTNSFDYDLYNAAIDVREEHGIVGFPVWKPGHGPDQGAALGNYQLDPSSPGYGKAVPLPNFNDMYAAPDIGTHQSGTPKMEFGVNAYLNQASRFAESPSPLVFANLSLAATAPAAKPGPTPVATAKFDAPVVVGPGVVRIESAALTSLEVNDRANAADWSIQGNIQAGDKIYGDRDYKIKKLPAGLTGLDWIRTANDSKKFMDPILATFTITADTEVYVAHDDRLTIRPMWMAGFSDTGEDLIIYDDKSEPVVFSIFKNRYPANTRVSLGNNGGSSDCSQYIVIVKVMNATKPD